MNHREIFQNDLKNICNTKCIDWSMLEGKNIVVTGATGLIGFTLASALLYYGQNKKQAPQVVALVRNIDKAKKMYADFQQDNLKFVIADVTEQIQIDEPVDYIIHGASQTASQAFVNEPIETIKTAIDGTINMLELARTKKVRSFVYLSSMEVYGTPPTDEKITEIHSTNLDTMSVRTSYPESKRMCEAMCTAYYKQYDVPAKVVRLTQTFGPGVGYNDSRVFAEFARCVIEKRDVILHTKGETKRNYLYTSDAVSAILTVLLNGISGEAYNAANEDTYCSVYDMAKMVVSEFADKGTHVKVHIDDEGKFGYAPVLKMNLDTSKLQKLGWTATTDLREMFLSLLKTMEG